jgi:hypothetical protein
MKSQIALLGIGLVIASGVAYAELKPASDTPTISTVATPDPTSSESASTSSIPEAGNTQTKVSTPKKSSLPMIANPTISRPSISGGGDDDDEDDDDEEEDERDDDEDDDEDDD